MHRPNARERAAEAARRAATATRAHAAGMLAGWAAEAAARRVHGALLRRALARAAARRQAAALDAWRAAAAARRRMRRALHTMLSRRGPQSVGLFLCPLLSMVESSGLLRAPKSGAASTTSQQVKHAADGYRQRSKQATNGHCWGKARPHGLLNCISLQNTQQTCLSWAPQAGARTPGGCARRLAAGGGHRARARAQGPAVPVACCMTVACRGASFPHVCSPGALHALRLR